MSRVYSGLLFDAGPLGGGTDDVLDGPVAGFVWVVRHIVAEYDGGHLGALSGFRMTVDGTAPLWFLGPLNIQQNRTYNWSGRYAINPGTSLQFFSPDPLSNGWLVSLHGYVLTLP